MLLHSRSCLNSQNRNIWVTWSFRLSFGCDVIVFWLFGGKKNLPEIVTTCSLQHTSDWQVNLCCQATAICLSFSLPKKCIRGIGLRACSVHSELTDLSGIMTWNSSFSSEKADNPMSVGLTMSQSAAGWTIGIVMLLWSCVLEQWCQL